MDKRTQSQFPTSNVNVLRNETADYAYDNKWDQGDTPETSFKTSRGSGTIAGHEGEHSASIFMKIPGTKGGSTDAAGYGSTVDDTGDNYQSTPNKARQVAYNRASADYVKGVKSGQFVKEGNAKEVKKGGTIKINSNPVKGK